MLSNKYLQIQPYDASKIFKHRKWVQRSPGLWWNVPSGLPRSHGGPNFGRRLARGQLRLCVGGPSSLVGAGEIWALTNCLEMFLGFPRSFGEKTAGRSGFGTTFWWFFRWCVCFVWKNRWQKCGKFHVHQEKNNFSGKANQNGNIGGIEPKIWVCIEFVSISRRTQMERNWLGEIGSAKYWKKIQQKNKLEANQQLKHHGTWDEHTVGRIWRHQYAKNVMSAADWGNCSGHLPRICYIWWWVCVSWVYVTVWPCDVDSQRHRVFTWMLRTSWLKPKLACQLVPESGEKGRYSDAVKTCCFPHCLCYKSQTFSEGQVASWSLHLPYPIKAPVIITWFYLHCWWECSPHAC